MLNIQKILRHVDYPWYLAEEPNVFVDVKGVSHVVFSALHNIDGIIKRRIWYTHDDSFGNFDLNDMLLVDSEHEDCCIPKVVANSDSKVFIAFVKDGNINISSNSGDELITGIFGTAVSIAAQINTSTTNCNSLNLAINQFSEKEFIYLAWLGTSGTQLIYYTDNTWGKFNNFIQTVPELTSFDCFNPRLVVLPISSVGNTAPLNVFIAYEQEDSSGYKRIKASLGNRNQFDNVGNFNVDGYKGVELSNNIDNFNVHATTSILRPGAAGSNHFFIAITWQTADNVIKFAYATKDNLSAFWEEDNGLINLVDSYVPQVAANHRDRFFITFRKFVDGEPHIYLYTQTVNLVDGIIVQDICDKYMFLNNNTDMQFLIDGDKHLHLIYNAGPEYDPNFYYLNNELVPNASDPDNPDLTTFEIRTNIDHSLTAIRSKISFYIDRKIGIIETQNVDAHGAVAWTDRNDIDGGEGNVYLLLGVITETPKQLLVEDTDGDNQPDFEWYIPGSQHPGGTEETDGWFDIGYTITGASGLVLYENAVYLKGVYVDNVPGLNVPGYKYVYEAETPIVTSGAITTVDWKIRKINGDWSSEYQFTIGDIAVSNPLIYAPYHPAQVEARPTDTITLRGDSEPDSTLISGILYEYNSPDPNVWSLLATHDLLTLLSPTISVVLEYPTGFFFNHISLDTIGLNANTEAVVFQGVIKDSEDNLSVPADSFSNILTIDNTLPTATLIVKDRTSDDRFFTNEQIVSLEINNISDDIEAWYISETLSTPSVTSTLFLTEQPLTYLLETNINEIKTVYLWVRDNAFNLNLVTISDTIFLDTIPSTATLLATDRTSGNPQFTNERTVSIEIADVSEPIIGWFLSETVTLQPDESFSGFVSEKPTTFFISEEFNQKTIYLWMKDIACNISEPIIYDTITLIDVPNVDDVIYTLFDRTSGSIHFTDERIISQLLTNIPELIEEYLFSETQTLMPDSGDPNFINFIPETFFLADYDGVHTVYVWLKNIEGDVTLSSISATILLDRESPELIRIEIFSPFGSSIATNSLTNLITLTVSGNPEEMKLFEPLDTGAPKEADVPWQPFNTPTPFIFNNNINEKKVVFARVRDAALNESRLVADSIIYDTLKPEVIFSTYNEANRTIRIVFTEEIKNVNLEDIDIFIR